MREHIVRVKATCPDFPHKNCSEMVIYEVRYESGAAQQFTIWAGAKQRSGRCRVPLQRCLLVPTSDRIIQVRCEGVRVRFFTDRVVTLDELGPDPDYLVSPFDPQQNKENER